VSWPVLPQSSSSSLYDDSTPPRIAAELGRDERVVWVGSPDRSRLFAARDLFLVPASLFWAVGMTFWESEAVKSGDLGLVLFGTPHVLIGLYLLVGRFVVRDWRKRNTRYVLTNLRAFILITLFRTTVRSTFLSVKKTMGSQERRDGSGTLRFGDTPPMSRMETFSLLEIGTAPGFAFSDIRSVNDVKMLAANSAKQLR
jgi:hypothetical protein